MWTNENRARYDRSYLRYPSDLSDDEWKLVEPLIPPGKRGGGKRTVIMREVVNGLMYILSTGCQWRAIPKDLPPRSTLVERTFAWLGRCRRLAKDWENLNRKALAFLRLASIRLMLRKLCNPA
jgi:transposase